MHWSCVPGESSGSERAFFACGPGWSVSSSAWFWSFSARVSRLMAEVDVGPSVFAEDTLALVCDLLASNLVLRGHVEEDDVHDTSRWK